MTVYKYLPIERVQFFEDQLLRFSQPAVLNDPFEYVPSPPLNLGISKLVADMLNHPDLSKVNPFLLEHSLHRTFAEILQGIGNRYSVFLSLSRIADSQRMWALYAGAHSGFVLGLDESHSFFKGEGKFGIHDVNYVGTRPTLTAFTDISQVFLIKGREWEYEYECRAIALPSVADEIRKDTDGREMYLFKCPDDCLKTFIFGYRTELNIRRNVRAYIKDRFPHVEIFEAALDTQQHRIRVEKSDENSDDALQAVQEIIEKEGRAFLAELDRQLVEKLPPEVVKVLRRQK